MEKIHDCTIKLIRYVIAGDKKALPNDIDFRELREFGLKHGIENMLYVALSELDIDVPEPIMNELQEDYEMQIVAEATQAYELEQLGEVFEKEGICYIPLKGSVIKYIYPMPDYRKSGDIDILIHPKDEDKVRSIMMAEGYSSEDDFEGHDVHYSYSKPPMLQIEVHRNLVRSSNRAYHFCSSVWDHVSLADGSKFKYNMEREFLYVYLMAHLSKHLYYGGAGIRLITDIYLMRKKYALDHKKIETYMAQANLSEIHNMILTLIDHWFNDIDSGDRNIDALEWIVLTGGSFGTADTARLMNSNDAYRNKIIGFLKMLFPTAKTLSPKYPVLTDKPYLLPAVWIYRAFYLIMNKRDSISQNTKNVFDTSMKNNDFSEIMEAVRNK